MTKVQKILIGLGLVGAIAVFAQAPVRLVTSGVTGLVLGAPGASYNSGLIAVTTGGTAITAVSTKVKVLFCRNNAATDTTLSVTDASANVYVPVQNLVTKGVFFLAGTDSGLTLVGVTVTAGANSAIACQVEGAQ